MHKIDLPAVLKEYEDDNKLFKVVGYPEIKLDFIRYSQDSIYRCFHDGMGYQELFNKLASREITPYAIPRIRVCAMSDGNYMSHDNRRLMVFKALQKEGYLDTIPCELVLTTIPEWQLSTRDDGRTVRVRQ